MNYNWLKNNQERAQALDDIISCLNMYRLSLDEIQLLKTTLVYNEEIISAAWLCCMATLSRYLPLLVDLTAQIGSDNSL